MLIKLEFSKAFDTLSWKYMKNLLLDFGFDMDWVNWILNLTSKLYFPFSLMGPHQKHSPLPKAFDKEILSHLLFSLSWKRD
jgi:hypothetical protein